uniref:Uncharacterized protein n=1 Tax=Glossina palpalis gambiensis TaxID=67801 RepID=A0A1B0AYM3_9MUSC
MCSSQNFRHTAPLLQALFLQKSINHGLFLRRFSYPSSLCLPLLKEIQFKLNMGNPDLKLRYESYIHMHRHLSGGGSRGGGHDIMQFLFSLPIIGLPLLLPDVLPYLLLDALQSHHWAHKIRVRHRNVYALANDRHNHPYRSKNWTNKLNRCWSHRNSPHFLFMSGNDVFRFVSPKMDLSGAHMLSKLIPSSVKSIGGGCAGLCIPDFDLILNSPIPLFFAVLVSPSGYQHCWYFYHFDFYSVEEIWLFDLLYWRDYRDVEEMADPIRNIYKCNRKSIDQWHASAGRHETFDPDQLQSHRHNSHNTQQTWYRNTSGNKNIFLQQLVMEFGNFLYIISCKGQSFNVRFDLANIKYLDRE